MSNVDNHLLDVTETHNSFVCCNQGLDDTARSLSRTITVRL